MVKFHFETNSWLKDSGFLDEKNSDNYELSSSLPLKVQALRKCFSNLIILKSEDAELALYWNIIERHTWDLLSKQLELPDAEFLISSVFFFIWYLILNAVAVNNFSSGQYSELARVQYLS